MRFLLAFLILQIAFLQIAEGARLDRKEFISLLRKKDPKTHEIAQEATHTLGLGPKELIQYAWATCQWRLAYEVAAHLPEADLVKARAVTAALAVLPWKTAKQRRSLKYSLDDWHEQIDQEIWDDENPSPISPPEFCESQEGPFAKNENAKTLVRYAREVFSELPTEDLATEGLFPLAIRVGTVPESVEAWLDAVPEDSIWRQWLIAQGAPDPKFRPEVVGKEKEFSIKALPFTFPAFLTKPTPAPWIWAQNWAQNWAAKP